MKNVNIFEYILGKKVTVVNLETEFSIDNRLRGLFQIDRKWYGYFESDGQPILVPDQEKMLAGLTGKEVKLRVENNRLQLR